MLTQQKGRRIKKQKTRMVSLGFRAAPDWPTNKNWWDIVRIHNEAVDRSAGPSEALSGAKSITLVMVCAVAGMPIPINYRLDTERAIGVSGHTKAVRDYLTAVRAGRFPQGYSYAKTVEKDVKLFANVLKADVQDVNDGLEEALTLGKIADKKIGSMIASDIESMKAEEGSEACFEGGKKKCLVNLYERSPRLRTEAILIHGHICSVCAFDFEKFYGERGYNYIEVHHLRPVSSLNGKEKVNPKSDMTVLCSNCHRMIHRFRDNVLAPEELKGFINKP